MGEEKKKRVDAETTDLVRLERLVSALELTNTFVFDQDKDFRFIRVYNPMYGYTNEDFVGKTDEDFISADYARKMLTVKKRVLKSGVTEQVQFSAEVAGMLRHYLLRVSRLADNDGTVTGITIVGSDITEIKSAENQRERMMARIEYMQRYESMAVMAEGISHDFNNLLSGVFGYIDLAHDSTIDPKTRQYIGKALTTIDRARALTQELVTYAKGGAPQKKPLDIRNWLRDVVMSALEGRTVKVDFIIPPELPLLNVDEQQLSRAIESIVTNGFQAASEAGKAAHIMISVETEVVTDDAGNKSGGAQQVCISITDNGDGIPDAIREKIFEPYFSTKGQGRGLSLATTHSIVQHHNGSISVDSIIDSGTTFHIRLPALKADNNAGKRKRWGRGGNTERILLMDDDEFILDAFSDVLISLGYSVTTARNGENVLELIRREHRESPFSAIILDLHVDRGNGAKEIINELRALVGDLPVFVASGSVDDHVMVNFESHGFTDRIDKPYKRKELSSLLNSYLER